MRKKYRKQLEQLADLRRDVYGGCPVPRGIVERLQRLEGRPDHTAAIGRLIVPLLPPLTVHVDHKKEADSIIEYVASTPGVTRAWLISLIAQGDDTPEGYTAHIGFSREPSSFGYGIGWY